VRSAAYFPFYRANLSYLSSCVDLNSDERSLLEMLLGSIESVGKAFELEDLLLLLQSKRAVVALNQKTLIQGGYLLYFDSLRNSRESLALKLLRFEKSVGLGKHVMTSGFCLDLPDIVKSKKHFFIQVKAEKNPLTNHLIHQLIAEIKAHRQPWGKNMPFVYLMNPQKLKETYITEGFLKELAENTTLRIFSKTYFSFNHPFLEWRTIFMPGHQIELERNEKERGFFQERIENEKKRLRAHINARSLFFEETVEAVKAITYQLRLKTALGFFTNRNTRSRDDKYLLRWFYMPIKAREKMDYEPYQKRFKAEDSLNLKSLVPHIKSLPVVHHPKAMQIIQDLRPKNQ